MASIKIFAPATVANLGPGFDVLGLALTSPGDLLDAELTTAGGVEVVEVTGDGGALSRDPSKNTAALAASDALRRARALAGVRLRLHKQMPLASGLGSSGASSAAGATAVNELLGKPLSPEEVLLSAMEGERAASGTVHADNVAPSLMGGIVLIRSYAPLEIIQLPVPPALRVVVVHPHCTVSTADARRLVKERTYGLEDIVPNLGNLGGLVSALYRNDLPALGRSIDDRLVEPVRAGLIPGFAAVKTAAITAGALGCSIAGSGPSMFAFVADDETAQKVAGAMQAGFRLAAQLASDVYLGKVAAQGARVV